MRFNLWEDCNRVPLTELLSFVVDNRGKTVPTAPSGHKLIATNCVTNNALFPVYEKIRYLSEETYQTWFRAHPIPGDILFVNKGTPGRVCLVPDPVDFCIAQDMIALRADESKIYPKYLFAVLRSREIQQQIYNTNVGDVIPHFKKQFLDQLLIPIPERSIQESIGDLYYVLSLKAERNKKINDNLLAQAQTLYKQFFPYGVQDDLPDGWRIGTVGEIIEIHDSKRIPLSGADRSKMEKKIYPYYGAASLMDLVDNYIFDGKYLLLGEDGTVVDDAGYPILQYVWGQFWVNNHAHILTGRLGYDVESLYMLFKQTPVKSIVTGAVQPKISQANLRSVQVVIPPEHNLREYNDLVEPLFSLFRANEEECKTFTALRDTLLPKLMSGEIDVSAVQL